MLALNRESSKTTKVGGRWVLEHDGRRLEVEASPPRPVREVRLFADGPQVAEHRTGLKSAELTADGLRVKVGWDWLGELSRCALIVKTEEKENEEEENEEIRFAPPEGSRAARRERLAREHPRLYASRHVALATGQVLLGLLGLGILIKLPKPDIPLPDLDLDLDPPDLPWPDLDLPSIPWPDIALPGWIMAILHTKKYWLPILIAVFVAIGEVEKRKRQRAKEEARAAEQAQEEAASPIGRGQGRVSLVKRGEATGADDGGTRHDQDDQPPA